MSKESGGSSQPPGENLNGDPLSQPREGDNFLPASNQGKSSDNVYRIDFENKYSRSDSGPYFVHVESIDKNIGRLFPIRIGHYLKVDDVYKKSIVDIKIVGRNRVKVVLNSYQAANSLINNDLLLKNGFIAYVPKYYTHRKGIVRLVDTFFDEDYLLDAIECDKEIVEIKRMMKRVTNDRGESELVKRQIIIVTFLGSNLPQSVRINGVIFTVEPYIYPVVQCMKCLAFGHVKSLCKKEIQLCLKCGEDLKDHKTPDCDKKTFYCIHCKTDEHSSTYRGCPHYQRQKRIKTIVSTRNVTFREAELLERNPSYSKVVTNNRFDILNNLSNFPELSTPQTRSGQSNDFQSASVTVPLRKPQRFVNNTPKINLPRQNLTTQYSEGPQKKRKAPNSPNTTQISSPIIPNPYREEFMAYKEQLTDKLTNFFMSSLAQVSVEKQANIEEGYLRNCIFALIGGKMLNKNSTAVVEDVNMIEDEQLLL